MGNDNIKDRDLSTNEKDFNLQSKKDTIIEVKDLLVAYDKEPVLWDVNVDIKEGVLLAIVGPNGAGKSTFIKALLGLLKPYNGDVKFWGKEYKKVRDKIAYVPQKGSVDWDFPTTVYDVVEMGRYGKIGWIKRVKNNDRKIVKDSIKKIGLTEFENRQISQLSGGQQQRVFLARALVQEAEIYFMDEPFQGVDKKTEESIVQLLKQLRANNKTVITVHHDLQTVKEYFDHVIFINKTVIAQGHVDEVFTEANIEKTYKERGSLNDRNDKSFTI